MSERRVLVNENSLIAIGSAIREKNGTDTSYKPGDMADAILEIETGITPEGDINIEDNGEFDITTYAKAIVNVEKGIIPEGDITITENGEYDVVNYAKAIVDVAGSGGEDVEIPVITGNCQYRFSENAWNWAVKLYGKQMSTKDITGAYNMFSNSSGLTEIPFDLNFKSTTQGSLESMLYYCSSLKEIPAINNAYPDNMGELFYQCSKVRYLPENLGENWNWDRIHTYKYAGADAVFKYCYSLRKIPDTFLKNFYNVYTSAYSSMYYETFRRCYNLDEISGLQVAPTTFTSNCFSYTFEYCYNLKKLTFATNEDGTPKTANWKSQTINLSSQVGYEDAEYSANNQYRDKYLWNSGRTIEKAIYNDETYALWKDDPDSYVCGFSKNSGGNPENPIDYSKYNRISAVETINSLPDCSSSGGVNTIMFKGAAGALTDGGAINTMTEEEIAVAAAKGWTVSLV